MGDECQHDWRFLRQERYRPIYGLRRGSDLNPDVGDRPYEVQDDVFFCSKCLAYRRVELSREDRSCRDWRNTSWKAVIPADGWFAIYLQKKMPDGKPGFWMERLLGWGLYDEDESEVGCPGTELIGLVGAIIPSTVDTLADDYPDCRFFDYVHEDDIDPAKEAEWEEAAKRHFEQKEDRYVDQG